MDKSEPYDWLKTGWRSVEQLACFFMFINLIGLGFVVLLPSRSLHMVNAPYHIVFGAFFCVLASLLVFWAKIERYEKFLFTAWGVFLILLLSKYHRSHLFFVGNPFCNVETSMGLNFVFVCTMLLFSILAGLMRVDESVGRNNLNSISIRFRFLFFACFAVNATTSLYTTVSFVEDIFFRSVLVSCDTPLEFRSGEVIKAQLVVSNESNRTVRIVGVNRSCKCVFVPDLSQLEILAGTSAIICVNIEADEIGWLREEIVLFTNDASRPRISIPISGKAGAS